MSQPEAPLSRRSGSSVIHDLGYRRYPGARLGTGAIGRSLFVTGLLNAFGFGRSAKAKALPLTLAGFMALPAVIMVGVMVLVGFLDGFLDYSTYPVQLMLLIVVFVAAQAPVLFARDLMSGAIALYLARPLRPAAFALVRWASLATAVFAFVGLPLLLLYVGAVAAEADLGEHTADFLAALVGAALLAAILAAVSGLVSAVTPRRGLAVGATIVALLVSTGLATSLMVIAVESGRDRLAQLAGLLSPFTLVDGLQHALLDGTASFPAPPEGAGTVLLYVLVAALLLAGSLGLLVRRYRRQAGR